MGWAGNGSNGDEWYDQGFDLGEEGKVDKARLEAYGINPELVKSVKEQVIVATQHQEVSDAKVNLREGTVKIDMDPLASKMQISTGNQDPAALTARSRSTTFGGGSSMFDRDNSRNGNRAATMDYSAPSSQSFYPADSIYSDSYIKQKTLEATQELSGRNSTSDFVGGDPVGEDLQDEYSTLSHRRRSTLSSNDNRYIQNRIAQRNQELAENDADSHMTHQQRIQEMRKRQIQEQRERFERERQRKALEKKQMQQRKNEQVGLAVPEENTLTQTTSTAQKAWSTSRTLYPQHKVATSADELARNASAVKSANPQRAQIWNEAHQALMAISKTGEKVYNDSGAKPFTRSNTFLGTTANIPAGLAIRGGRRDRSVISAYTPLFTAQNDESESSSLSAEPADNRIFSSSGTRPSRVLAEDQGGPVDESTRSHASRMNAKAKDSMLLPDNSEKTLEELAKEYPGLSPEHLIKLKRSSHRCHLVSRTPVFDANSNISMYELKFTAGKLFQVNSLKSEHVYHVLFGYFIRRGVSCFIGRRPNVMVMMPITYDFLDYIDRYSVNRVVLRICPEQPVTPSALHILTRLRRSGMSFAIDLMLLLKKDWNRAILSIEYVMIDLSAKVKEQLHVFQRLKIKAPWLKTVGYNDVNNEGYRYLSHHQIDYLDAPFWMPQLRFNQDPEFFKPMQQEVLGLIHQLFADEPDYSVFSRFLNTHESLSRDMAVFLYRFRHASPRQVQSSHDLFQYLQETTPGRSFSVLAGRAMMLYYVKSVTISSQEILQEYFKQALIRGYFCEYLNKVMANPDLERFGFQAGMFSLLHLFLLKEEVDVIADDQYADIYDRIYSSEVLSDAIDCISAIENTNLSSIFSFIQKYHIPPASVLISHEKAVMRTNELLLILNIATVRK